MQLKQPEKILVNLGGGDNMQITPGMKGSKKEPLYVWIGCTTRAFLKDSAENLFLLLNKFKIKYKTIDDTDACCGSVLFVTGQNMAALENLVKTEKILSEKKVKHLLSICPGCTRTFKEFYLPRKTNPLQTVVHYTEHFQDKLKGMELKKAGKYIVTYHDPCHLARHMGITEPPRAIIRSLPGVTFKELPLHEDDSFCCGSGGGMRSYNKDMANQASLLRLQEADELGVDILLTSCPFCERSFRSAQDLTGAPKKLEIVNLVDFLPKFIK
jgi:heterodisulfide reductase subunit D